MNEPWEDEPDDTSPWDKLIWDIAVSICPRAVSDGRVMRLPSSLS